MLLGLDTDIFLNAFDRRYRWNGSVKEMIGDNGTNDVGAENELKEFTNQIDKNKTQRTTA